MVTTAANSADNIQTIVNPKKTTLSKSGQAGAKLTEDLDDFLLLLTTQLKNQDPTNPMDTAAFTQQIATLSSVEQQINTNRNLEQMISLFTNSQTSNLVGYISKLVEAEGNKGVLQNGVATFAYDLETEAKKALVTISDSTGAVVYKGDGALLQGHNQVFWNGKNSFTEKQMPDGIYTFKVEATDAQNKVVKSTTYTAGIVSSVDFKDGKPMLALGDLLIDMNKVLKITEDPVALAAQQAQNDG